MIENKIRMRTGTINLTAVSVFTFFILFLFGLIQPRDLFPDAYSLMRFILAVTSWFKLLNRK